MLVVEDNGTSRPMMHRLLEHLGVTCGFAVDGIEAFRMATTETFDLMLLDINMSEMDGVAAFAEMMRLRGDAVPPVLVLTASALPEDVESFLRAGMVRCVTTPLADANLVQAICVALGQDYVAPRGGHCAKKVRQSLTDRQRAVVLGLIATIEE